MDDDPKVIDFADFAPGKTPPRAAKRRVRPNEERNYTDEAQSAADDVAELDEFADQSIEQISALAIRTMANIVLKGGKKFRPSNLLEATNAAKGWAAIASMERAGRAGKQSSLNEDDPAVKEARDELARFRDQMGKPKQSKQ